MTGKAVKLTIVPVHVGFADVVIDTEGSSTGLKFIVIGADVAGFPVGQVMLE